MKNYVYAEKKANLYTLFLFNEDKPVDSSFDFHAVMMSRMDFDVKISELPSIPDKEIEGFLKYRIRSLYPGHPEETVLDCRILTIKKKKYAVLFLSQKAILDEYRKISGEKPLFLPFTLIQPFLNKYSSQDIIFLFWHTFWIETLIFQENEAPNSLVLKRGKKISLDIDHVSRIIPEDSGRFRWIIFCADREKELLEEKIGQLADRDLDVEIFPIQEALNRINRKTEFLFERKKSKNLLPQKIRIQILFAVILFISAFLFKRSVDQEGEYFNDLKDHLSSLQKQTSRVISLQSEIDTVQEKLDILKGKRPIDPYLILSELASILKTGTRIQSFILEKSFFQLEAVGPNPLALMEIFKDNELFENVKLVQIVPIKDSDQELFKITGRVNVK